MNRRQHKKIIEKYKGTSSSRLIEIVSCTIRGKTYERIISIDPSNNVVIYDYVINQFHNIEEGESLNYWNYWGRVLRKER